jgi:hypothetical protein
LSTDPIQLDAQESKDFFAAIRECWTKLTTLQRVALAYSAFGGQKPDLPREKIYNNANKGRENLRICLREAGQEFPDFGI